MASQVAIFAETIAGLKKAAKRKAYDSDSDDSIDQLTNRGNKLRKKARFIHEGQLAPPTGPEVYKRRIEHAGFQREIISRNPPLFDDEGYEVDSEDDDERAHAAAAAAAEFDPYAGVKIEYLLAPLTAASDLPHHPTLSRPFTSKTLTDLTQNAGNMVQKEKATLWRIKHLLTRMSGDSTWMPCETVETENDVTLFMDERDRGRGQILGKVIVREEADVVSTGTLVSEDAGTLAIEDGHVETTLDAGKNLVEKSTPGDDVLMTFLADGSASTARASDISGALMKHSKETNGTGAQKNGHEDEKQDVTNRENMELDEPVNTTNSQTQEVEEDGGVGAEAEGEDQEDLPAPHRMRTRARAAKATSDHTAESRTRSMSPDSGSESYIHPYFLAAASSHPDRDIGLPQNEAEETRRVLQLYIQKQEEVCRGVQKIYDGLLRADRYRKLVMKWAKAEAHVGVNRDMSDGEDWYDKEEWGLDEDLKKGQDEEEEDAATTAKKTRTRRQ